MWRHEDIWRTLGGGIDFVTGVPLADEWEQSRKGLESAGLVRLMRGTAHPRRRPGGDARGAVRRGHRGAAAAFRRPRGLARGRAPQGQPDLHHRRRDGQAADRGLPRGRATTPPRCWPSPPAAALFSPVVKDACVAALPNVVITDAIGSTETGFAGIGLVTAGAQQRGGPTVTPGPEVIVLDDDGRPAGPGQVGRLARGGHVPLGYYKDPAKTAAMFAEVDGKRYAVPGDLARVEADGIGDAARPRQHVREHRRREGLPRGGGGRAQVPSRRVRRAGHRRRRRAARAAGGGAGAAARGRGPSTWPRSRPTSAARSPGTRRRAASGWSRPSAAGRPASPTTGGRTATRPATRLTRWRRENRADDAVRPARHRAPHCRLQPVRARRRRDQPGRRPGRARLRPLQRPGRPGRRPAAGWTPTPAAGRTASTS